MGATLTSIGQPPCAPTGTDLVLSGRRRHDRTPRPDLHRAPTYAEALAFSLRKHRPRAEVSLLDPSGDLEEEARRVRPHLIVANRVPRAAKGGAFWMEVAEPIGGGGARGLDAKISADGYSRTVDNVLTEHVLVALDRAEAQPILGGGQARSNEEAS